MELGYGEYYNISSYVRMPYNVEKLISIIEMLIENEHLVFNSGSLLNINPGSVTYNKIWDGVDSLDFGDEYLAELLQKYVIEYINFTYHNEPVRVQVSFLNEDFYEVSVIYNYEYVCDNDRFKIIELISMNIFNSLCPEYGVIGVEQSVIDGVSINTRINNNADAVYYSPISFSQIKNDYEQITELDIIKLENGGVFIKRSK